MIESIQRRYTSQMEQYRRWDEQKRCFVSTLNYWERLKKPKLYSLERRREILSLMQPNSLFSIYFSLTILWVLRTISKKQGRSTGYFHGGKRCSVRDDLVTAMQEVFAEGRVLNYLLGADMDGATTYLVVDRTNVFTSFINQINFVLENPFVTLKINLHGEFSWFWLRNNLILYTTKNIFSCCKLFSSKKTSFLVQNCLLKNWGINCHNSLIFCPATIIFFSDCRWPPGPQEILKKKMT